MKQLVAKLQRTYPDFSFVTGTTAQWSSEKQEVTYRLEDSIEAIWALLHELGHGILGHKTYDSDISLLRMETAAWQQARELATIHGIKISSEHIEDCLDTYRDWLHKRSTCPECSSQGLQRAKRLYACFNCQTTWEITESRFCRPYRLKKARTA